MCLRRLKFQSTLPVWGATFSPASPSTARKNFNPRSPCGERRSPESSVFFMGAISIHAPRVGSDRLKMSKTHEKNISIHAPRVGSDPNVATNDQMPTYISIHAPRVGSDIRAAQNLHRWRYFNPRSPCGERRFVLCFPRNIPKFQSTLPVWGATVR